MTCWYVAGGESRKPHSEPVSAAAVAEPGRGDPDEPEPGAVEVEGEECDDDPHAMRTMPSRAGQVR